MMRAAEPEEADVDWSRCPDVESRPDVMSGRWIVVGTRVPADSVVEHAETGFTAEEIATEIFPSVPLARLKRIVAFAEGHLARSA